MNKVKWITFGIGAVAGIVVSTLVSGRPSVFRNALTSILGYGINAKQKVENLAGVAKENLTDIVAEGDQKAQDLQAGQTDGREG
ncbi:MAG: hypothetical protein LBF41_08160 [Deltaproteobacteria bacterium]|jgi:hypothetical protein|nr:hypothetical protein [Deltaproteobacteria bacterium]